MAVVKPGAVSGGPRTAAEWEAQVSSSRGGKPPQGPWSKATASVPSYGRLDFTEGTPYHPTKLQRRMECKWLGSLERVWCEAE